QKPFQGADIALNEDARHLLVILQPNGKLARAGLDGLEQANHLHDLPQRFRNRNGLFHSHPTFIWIIARPLAVFCPFPAAPTSPPTDALSYLSRSRSGKNSPVGQGSSAGSSQRGPGSRWAAPLEGREPP